MPLLPYVRRELYLQAIKNRDASALPDPNNREELFLKAIAEDVALIPSGVPVALPAAVSEMLANLPEPHTHTERFYSAIIDAILVTTTVTDTTPYISRETAGGLSVSGTAKLKKKLGNTVGVNQLLNVNATTETISGVTITMNANHTITLSGGTASANIAKNLNAGCPIINGHKYYIAGGYSASIYIDNLATSALKCDEPSIIKACDITASGVVFRLRVLSGTDVSSPVTLNPPQLIDLTLWFGSNDRIPSDLLSHPENWGRYYAGSLAYNAGTLESADGTVMKSIGRNVWDEEWEVGAYNVNTGAKVADNARIRSKNLIPVIPNTQYYFYFGYNIGSYGFAAIWYDADGNYISGAIKYGNTQTSPANARFCAFYTQPQYGTTYLNDITISLYYSGESGYDQYYPYSVLAEVDTGSEVLRSAGSVADEKTPDGTITRRVGVVDLGSLTWSASSSDTSGYNRFISVETVGVNTPTGARGNVRSAKYIAITGNDAYSRITGVTLSSAGKVVIYDETLAQGTAAAFKTAMSGVYLYYELATPTTEQGTPFDPEYVVEDGGTESWTNLKGIPQGHETEYTEYMT